MSSKKQLKEIIKNSLGMLYIDCILYTATSKEPNFDKLEVILADLNKTRNDLVSRMSVSEGKELKTRTKAYYNKIKQDLQSELNRIGKEIAALD